MASEEVDCEIRLLNQQSPYDELSHPTADLKHRPDISIETRLKWASAVIAVVHSASETPNRLRPWCLDLYLDGTVISRLVPLEGDAYPARFRIPSKYLGGYDSQGAIKRTELFALGSLLYQLESGQKPFEDLSDEEVQHKYGAASAHGLEKSEGTSNPSKPQSFFSRNISQLVSHAQEHPVLFFFQATGTLLLVSSLLVAPVLSIVGFGAVGPVAGSAAAAWQASIGLVQAGSLFAWCQSVAMGGAAFYGILGAAAIGGGLAGGATLLAFLDRATLLKKIQAYMVHLKLNEAALFLAQANKMLGAGIANAAAGIASLDVSEQLDAVRRAFESVRLGGRTLNVVCANAAAGAGASGAGTVMRLGEVYRGVAAAAAERRLDQAFVGALNDVADSATGTVRRLDETFKGLFRW